MEVNNHMLNIPSEKQEGNRSCGAAALVMVLKSFGILHSQKDIWHQISTPDSLGTRYSTVGNVCKYALDVGLHAVAIKAKYPFNILDICHDNSIRVILNHRLNKKSQLGHFTVMNDINKKHIIINDPSYGNTKRVMKFDFELLWKPNASNCEIVGNVLIAITDKNCTAFECNFCGTRIPNSICCPCCNKEILLQPNIVLGCFNEGCPKKLWDDIICPFCNTRIAY